jgi:leucine dehydrogenase
MEMFEYMEKYGHEQLVLCHDKASGLKAIIAIHNTNLGPLWAACVCGHTLPKRLLF